MSFQVTPGWLPYHPNPSVPAFALPPGAVDAHCHVFGPGDEFPFAPERTYTPEAGKPLTVEMQGKKLTGPVVVIPAKPGFLNMRSSPWVNVRIGKEKIGSTTFLNAKVPSGRQVLQLSNPEAGINETLVVTIPEDKTLNVTLEWEQTKAKDWRIKSKSIK